MSPRKHQATIRDIAAEAGVSLMTVSKVMNRKAGISGETSQRILEIARQLNYRPNQIARSLRADETFTLGVVVSDSSHLLFAKVIRGIEDAARHEGYSVIIANTDQNADREKQAVELLLNKRIDGLILGAPAHAGAEDIQMLARFGIPLVLLMRTSPSADVDCVINDNFEGGYEITKFLLDTGCEDPYFLSMPEQNQSSLIRLEGSRKALAELGRDMPDNRVRHCEPYIDAGCQAMHHLLDQGVRRGCICCGCDLIAIGAIQAVQSRHLSVPDDFRITGYDDIELAEYLSVPLTTMRQPAEEIGREGARQLIEHIRNPDKPPRTTLLRSTLIRRRSA
jgi:DNA-binding LacI/PurR family transcriptional regulator